MYSNILSVCLSNIFFSENSCKFHFKVIPPAICLSKPTTYQKPLEIFLHFPYTKFAAVKRRYPATMQVEIKIDPSCKEPKIIVLTDKITDEISLLVRKISEESPQILAGFQKDTLEILDPQDIFRIYAASGKVFATAVKGEYTLRLRLYELEERLDKSQFVRISNSEIINLKKVKSFDLSFTGTICVSLLDGTLTYVSRRYVTKIKQVLGI